MRKIGQTFSFLIPVIAVAILLVQGCATSKFVVTGNTYPPYNGPIKVFLSPPEDIEYEEIGIVSSSSSVILPIHEWTHLIEVMQKKAASKGANAIIIIKEERAVGTGEKNLMAIAIRIK